MGHCPRTQNQEPESQQRTTKPSRREEKHKKPSSFQTRRSGSSRVRGSLNRHPMPGPRPPTSCFDGAWRSSPRPSTLDPRPEEQDGAPTVLRPLSSLLRNVCLLTTVPRPLRSSSVTCPLGSVSMGLRPRPMGALLQPAPQPDGLWQPLHRLFSVIRLLMALLCRL